MGSKLGEWESLGELTVVVSSTPVKNLEYFEVVGRHTQRVLDTFVFQPTLVPVRVNIRPGCLLDQIEFQRFWDRCHSAIRP